MSTFLSNLPKLVEKTKKRLGRGHGTGKGAKSGRGTTRHQKARENVGNAFEGGQGKMTKRFPLLRGKSKNKSAQSKPLVVSISQLNEFADGDTVTIQALAERNMIDVTVKGVSVKVLDNGELKKKLTVVLPVSQSAKAKIEAAGGTVQSV